MEYQRRESTASRSPVAIQRPTSTLHKLTEASDGTPIIRVFTGLGLGALLLAAGGPWHARALKVLSSLVGSGILCLMLAGVSEATVPRAFVSINGSDLNPCSAVQPCRSFNQALTVVEPGGEIVVQDSGGYSTGFTITRSVTIDAAGFNASVISTSATDLCTINAGTSDRVVLRGISFHGASVGNDAINVTQVGSLYIEHCSISEFTGFGLDMLNGGDLFVTDTDMRKCSADGVRFGTAGITPAHLVAHDSRFTECGHEGVSIETLGTAGAVGWLSNCTASLCADSGFSAAVGQTNSGSADLTLINCRSIGNTIGIDAETVGAQNVTVRIANCVVTGNDIGIGAASSGLGGTAAVIGTSPGTNLISGNTSRNSTVGTAVTLQ